MKQIQRIHEQKNSAGKWYCNFIENDETLVYKQLCCELIAKKLEQCSYIKSIKRKQNYDGTIDIIISYTNNCRNIYTVKATW